ncbi:hypothetical protein ACIBG8_47240 [Nonomuraea sp. NPDC050556]|uniref:hypothetical protein n=1 Tax=Nonomuraea sp. NPDC050556 TaxID=3364369 RepID=UPI0037B2BCA3
MTRSHLAQALFASPLQPSQHPTIAQVRAALQAARADVAARVAQEAGDHPEAYAARMQWALATVSGLPTA